jgi:TPR repeat protein
MRSNVETTGWVKNVTIDQSFFEKKGRHEEAVKWYKKAAAQGEMCAQSNLGNCYERGEGVKKDIPEALKWYGKAAEQGNAEAAKNILRLAKAMQVE